MAKWDMTAKRYFLSFFDGVQYAVPVDDRKKWVKWMCSNEPTLPDYVVAVVAGEFTFTDPQNG